MAQKNWQYYGQGDGFGTMRCCTCQRDASGKPFRVHEDQGAKDRGFVVQCRHCSAAAPGWQDFDQRRAARRQEVAQRLAAFRAFRARWGTDNLDEEIQQLESEFELTSPAA